MIIKLVILMILGESKNKNISKDKETNKMTLTLKKEDKKPLMNLSLG